MGRDIQAQASFNGQSGLARALLEPDALILRGGVRAHVARSNLHHPRINGDTLHLTTPDGPLTLTMGATEAAKWLHALTKPLPTLAQKLGLAGQRLWLLTPVTDTALAHALTTATTATADHATMALSVLHSAADLAHLLDVAASHPALTFWALNIKGPDAPLPESAIRTALRSAGLIDSKSCAVSPTLSATRYARRKA